MHKKHKQKRTHITSDCGLFFFYGGNLSAAVEEGLTMALPCASCPASRTPLVLVVVVVDCRCHMQKSRAQQGKAKGERGERSGLAATLLITFYYNVLVGVIFMVFAMLNDFFMCPAIFYHLFPPPPAYPISLLLSMLIALGAEDARAGQDNPTKWVDWRSRGGAGKGTAWLIKKK